MARTRSLIVCALVALTLSVPSHAAASDGGTTDTTVPAALVTGDTNVWRAENDPSACLNSMPRPDCGFKPQDAGERGGWLQLTVFYVMIAALVLIGTVIFRNVARRDREIAARLAREEQSTASQDTPDTPK